MSQTNNTNTETNTQLSSQAIAWQRYILKRENSLPNWLIDKSMGFFFISMFACWIAWGYVPNYDLIFTTIISIILFFYVGRSMSNKYSLLGEKKFLRSIFSVGLIVRILWVLYMFFVFNPRYYDTTYGSAEDVEWYIPFGKELSLWFSGDSPYSLSQIINNVYTAAIDDIGYPMLLGVEYLLTGGISDVLIPMIIKSFLGAYCSICVHRVTKRHFGDGVAHKQQNKTTQYTWYE